MQQVAVAARQTRTQYRHELRTLTYITLDEANGGIIRNLNRHGVAVQAVGALRQEQRVRLRFELRFPRLRVETYGQVSWASPSGQCGIRFLDLPVFTGHQINQWIFAGLIESLASHCSNQPPSIFGASAGTIGRLENGRDENSTQENDGLRLSPAPRPAIRLKTSYVGDERHGFHRFSEAGHADPVGEPGAQMDWLARPISGRTLALLVDGLVMIAALLLFALTFLSITHELPQWPLALGAGSAAAVFVAAAYWALMASFGGESLGARVAKAASGLEEETESAGRFR